MTYCHLLHAFCFITVFLKSFLYDHSTFSCCVCKQDIEISIRHDYQNSLSSINLALNSKDSETAHYAASILQDVLNNFRSQVQEKYLLCQEENEQQVENCVNLVEYMNPILEQKVLTDIEQKSMTDKMQEVLQKAWDLDKIRISSTVYIFRSL